MTSPKFPMVRAIGFGSYQMDSDGHWWCLNPQTGWVKAEGRAFTHYLTTEGGGFFVDWNGTVRSVESPGDGYSCSVFLRNGLLVVDVTDSSEDVIFEADFHATKEAIAERLAGA